MKKLRVVQIGTEHDHAGCMIETLKNHSDVFDLVGYCREEKSDWYEKTKKSYEGIKVLTLDEVFSDGTIEAAVIETCEHDLTKYAYLAAKHNLHVQMDKPGGTDHGEFLKLLDLIKEKNLVFHMGYMYRLNPAVMRAHEIVNSGALGDIYSVEAHMDCDHPKEKRQWLSQYKGGMTFFLGCHLTDLVIQFQGEPLEIIPFNTATHKDGAESEDLGMALFRYKNGVSFIKSCAAEAGGFMKRQLVICGTKGTLEICPLEIYAHEKGDFMLSTKMRETYEGEGWGSEGKITEFEPFERYYPFLLEFAEIVRGIKQNPFSLEYEAKLHEYVMKTCGK